MIEIVPIPAFEDNYIWLLRNGASAVVVDPGDAGPVVDYLRLHRVQLVSSCSPTITGTIPAALPNCNDASTLRFTARAAKPFPASPIRLEKAT